MDQKTLQCRMSRDSVAVLAGGCGMRCVDAYFAGSPIAVWVAATTPDGEGPWRMDGLSPEEITEVRVEFERLMVEAVGL